MRELGFYDWTYVEYRSFVMANQQYLSTAYANVAKEVETKTISEVKKYS